MESQETRDTGQIIQSLQTRLDRLESRNRLLTLALLGIVGLSSLFVILSAAAAPSVPDVIRAKSFEVVDENGNLRGVLGLYGDGGPSLILFTASGRPMAILGESSTKDRGGLWLFDELALSSIVLGSFLDDQQGLLVWDLGSGAAIIGVDSTGTPVIQLSDAADGVLFSAP